MNPTKVKEKLKTEDFLREIKKFRKEQIECTRHTFFRLSESQRKIYTCNELKRILHEEKPFLVGIQINNNHAVFYRYKNKTLRVILSIINRKVNIVTFFFIQEWQIPKI